MDDSQIRKDFYNIVHNNKRISNLTKENITKLINYSKIIKNEYLLSSVCLYLGYYYWWKKCYKKCIKFLKLHQKTCREGFGFARRNYYLTYGRECGRGCLNTHFKLSECYIKVGNLEKGIEIFENYLITYKRKNENEGQPPLGCCDVPIKKFSKNLKFSKGRFKSKW